MAREQIAEIIICPASSSAAQAHIAATVADGVSWGEIASVLSDSSSEKLQSLVDSDGELRFWGFQDNDRIKRDTLEKPPQSWERMPEGSLLVFTNRAEVSHTAVIAARMYDANVASRLWDADEFHWVVALRDVQSVTGISSQQLRDAADVRGVFMALPVRSERRSEVLSLLAGSGWSAAEARAAASAAVRVATFDPDSPLSAPSTGERRLEQPWLRGTLIPGDQGACDVCGKEFPAAFLRAAHIKPRRLCSDAERRDPTNAFVACVLCDIAFERGWLAFGPEQQVLVSGSRSSTGDLAKHLTAVQGRTVARPLRQESTAFHRARLFTA